MAMRVLVINPGSTSTKLGLYENNGEVFCINVSHSSEEIAKYATIADQLSFREETIRNSLKQHELDISSVSCVVGRGGLLRPIPGGVYKVSEAMKADLLSARYGEHASNLGALIADAIAKELGVPAFIADPVVVDELSGVSRIYGHKLFKKTSIFHALNQKAVARRWAEENKKAYEDCILVVAHMGGGLSVGLHSHGRVVDVNNALNGEGPFSPERAGTLPAGALVKLCFSGEYTEKQILKMITGQGGIVSLADTNDMRVLEEKKKAGDANAALIYDAFIYNVGKAIGALAAAAKGMADAIILTGGIAHGRDVVDGIKAMVGWMAPVVVYPGEGELEALAAAGQRGLEGKAMEYEAK